MKKKTSDNSKIYREFIKNLEIKGVYLKNGIIDFKNEDIDIRETAPKLVTKATYSQMDEKKFKLYHEYSLKIINKKTKKMDVSIKCSFVVVYSNKVQINDEIFKQFSKFNLRHHTWPYFREFVQNATGRLNLPPLTIPLIKTI